MDLMNLVAKVTLDSSAYEKSMKGLASKAGKVLGGITKIGAAAITAAGAAVVAITKQAVDAYGEYEQLTGGIETLYGENSKAADEMMKHASEAWKTAGMSANEYMETAIESSAALINSLGGDTEKAAKLMDMSIVDMADNVNKMGTTMEGVQNAYRGFSRGNFTMLDNLALGFAGTKEGMQQLLDKAEEFAAKNGEIRDFSIDSYADIVEAIHIVQEEMGIAGTTAKEAASTIQGSFNSMKSAWKNLLIAFGSGKGVKEAIGNLVDSAKIYVKNLIPVIKQALIGIAVFIKEIGPVIIAELPGLIAELLPELLNAAVSLVGALIQALPGILSALWESLKTMFGTFSDWLHEQSPELATAFDGLIEAGKKTIDFFANFKENMATIWEQVKEIAVTKTSEMGDMLAGKWDAIKNAYEEHGGGLKGICSATVEALKQYMTLGFDTINTLTGGKLDSLKQKVTNVFDRVKDVVRNAVERLKSIMNFHWELPHLKLPHLSISGSFSINPPSVPHFSIEWYKKAYENPYMFTRPTVMGLGDGVGGEIVYGHNKLMDDIKDAVSEAGGSRSIVINVYPQKGQSEEEIARNVEKVLTRWDKQRKVAGFA